MDEIQLNQTLDQLLCFVLVAGDLSGGNIFVRRRVSIPLPKRSGYRIGRRDRLIAVPRPLHLLILRSQPSFL
jgi:hypothetical protein